MIRHHALNVGQLEFLEVGSEMTLLMSRVFPYVSIKNVETAAVVIAEVVDAVERGKRFNVAAFGIENGTRSLGPSDRALR